MEKLSRAYKYRPADTRYSPSDESFLFKAYIVQYQRPQVWAKIDIIPPNHRGLVDWNVDLLMSTRTLCRLLVIAPLGSW
jgi:hypothetical protein